MKKVFLSLAVVAALTVVSCKQAEANTEAAADSTAVEAVDTAAAVVDSAAATVDSAAAKVEDAAKATEEAAKEVLGRAGGATGWLCRRGIHPPAPRPPCGPDNSW